MTDSFASHWTLTATTRLNRDSVQTLFKSWSKLTTLYPSPSPKIHSAEEDFTPWQKHTDGYNGDLDTNDVSPTLKILKESPPPRTVRPCGVSASKACDTKIRENLKAAREQFPYFLEELIMNKCPELLGTTCLPIISRLGPQLTHLALDRVEDVMDEDMLHVWRHCINLRGLSLNETVFTDILLVAMTESMNASPDSSTTNNSTTPGFSSASMVQRASRWPLTYLDVMDTDASDMGIVIPSKTDSFEILSRCNQEMENAISFRPLNLVFDCDPFIFNGTIGDYDISDSFTKYYEDAVATPFDYDNFQDFLATAGILFLDEQPTTMQTRYFGEHYEELYNIMKERAEHDVNITGPEEDSAALFCQKIRNTFKASERKKQTDGAHNDIRTLIDAAEHSPLKELYQYGRSRPEEHLTFILGMLRPIFDRPDMSRLAQRWLTYRRFCFDHRQTEYPWMLFS
ncbi:MAG: hypothetical protein J3Q66DRAFT_368728 [Benniella sp.]|nr:MAG: hypothetical protein J3Q66DRAFT_368728 [Benniella sp.]